MKSDGPIKAGGRRKEARVKGCVHGLRAHHVVRIAIAIAIARPAYATGRLLSMYIR